MKKTVFGSLAIILTLVFSGCAQKMYRYTPDSANVLYVKNASKGNNISVEKFTDSGKEQRTISCRVIKPMEIANGNTFASYIQDSLTQELMVAEKYDAKASNHISANLDKIESSTLFGNAYWDFDVTIKSSNGVSYQTSSKYTYSSTLDGDVACENMRRSFPDAVRVLNSEIIKDPKFGSLFEK